MELIPLVVASGGAAALAAAALVRLQPWLPILDVPNERSSHDVPKPRTGGIALLLGLALGALVAGGGLLRDRPHAAWLLGGCGFFFALGFTDDVRRLRARTRLSLQAAFCLALAALGPRLEFVELPGLDPFPLAPAVGVSLTAFWLVGFVNLFNFMDGIDGLAASEACLVGVLMFWVTGDVLALLVAASSAGFLALNLQPSRLFMGDGGSYLLGFLLAYLSLTLSRPAGGSVPFETFVLFSGTFIADTTVTLLRRMANGEPFMESHRSHYYQRLTELGFSHSAVTGMNLSAGLALGAGGWAYARVPEFRLPVLGAAMLLMGCLFGWIHARRGP